MSLNRKGSTSSLPGGSVPTNPSSVSSSSAFYEPPSHRVLPSQIIEESRSYLQTVQTRRPFTPKEGGTGHGSSSSKSGGSRILFANAETIGGASNVIPSGQPSDSRPPSAFVLTAKHFVESANDSRPPSGTRLLPINFKPRPPSTNSPPSSAGIQSYNETSSSIQSPSQSGDGVIPSSMKQQSKTTIKRKPSKGGDDRIKEDIVSADTLLSSKPMTIENRKTTVVTSQQKQSTNNRMKKVHSLSIDKHDLTVENPFLPVENARTSSATPSETSSRGSSGDVVQRKSSHHSSAKVSHLQMKTPSVDSNTASANDEYYNQRILPILDLLTASTSELQDLRDLTDALYTELKAGNLLGRQCRKRADILKVVYCHLDKEDARLYVALSKIILSLKVSGENLTNVCKLLFRVAKDHTNDVYFQECQMSDILVETLANISANATTTSQVPYDALVYLTGAIKFLSSNPNLSENLLCNSLVEKLVSVLHVIIIYPSTNSTTSTSNALDKIATTTSSKSSSYSSHHTSDRLNHILDLVLASLCNIYKHHDNTRYYLLSDDNTSPSIRNTFIEDLCVALERYSHDVELVYHASRLLSRLTMHADPCQKLSRQFSFCHVCLGLLQRYHDRENLVLHLSYTLGNLAARHEECRISLFPDKSKLDILLSVIMHYWKLLNNQNTTNQNGTNPVSTRRGKAASSPGSEPANSVEDTLVKLIRIIANCALSDTVGPVIASSKTCLGLLLGLISAKRPEESEELVINSIATVNNITYYLNEDVCSDYEMRLLKVAEALLSLMIQEEHMEALKGAVRVFGNLSRSVAVRDFIVQHQLDRMLITLLDSNHVDLVYGSVGVLLNLTNDPNKRSILKQEDGLERLIEIMGDFGRGCQDWKLVSLVCQTLWNYTEGITRTEAAFGGSEQAHRVIDLLAEYLDEEVAEAYNRSEDRGYEVECHLMEIWSTEFVPVATSLLQRLDRHLSPLQAL